jgi:hypothetical protein
MTHKITSWPSYAELLYDTSTVISYSPQTNTMQVIKIKDIILSHIRIFYLLCYLFPSHYMLSFDILFFSVLLPAAIVIFVRGQHRTAHDANSTSLTVLLFLHILTKRHKTMIQITRLSTAHDDWTFQKVMHVKGTMDSQQGSCLYTSNCRILHCSKDSIRNSTLIIQKQKLLLSSPN